MSDFLNDSFLIRLAVNLMTLLASLAMVLLIVKLYQPPIELFLRWWRAKSVVPGRSARPVRRLAVAAGIGAVAGVVLLVLILATQQLLYAAR